MSEQPLNEIDLLAQEELELARKLEEIKQKKTEILRKAEEAKRFAELTKPVVVHVAALEGNTISMRSEFRSDVVNVMKFIRGRMYRGAHENAFPIGEWNVLREKLLQLPNVTIDFADGVEEAIDNYLNAPTWEMDINSKYVTAKPGPLANHYLLNNIPGIVFKGNIYTIPLNEGWRVAQVFAEVAGVVWTEEAQKFVIEQAKQRALLDSIAQLEDSPEHDFVFDNGKVKARAFQRVGVAFIEATGGRCLVGDAPGLGKTAQALAYCERQRKKNPKFATLICCPASLKANWEHHIYNYTGIRPRVLSGSVWTNTDLIALLTDPRPYTIINYDILGRVKEVDKSFVDERGITHKNVTEQFLWVDALKLVKFDCVIDDEAHYLKNVSSNRSQASRQMTAPHVLELTATPVMNRPAELWPALHKIAPELFPNYEGFINRYTYNGKEARNVNELRELVKNIMIRRKKEDVIKDLPPINRIYEYVELSDKARKLYEKVLRGMYETIDHAGNDIQKEVTNILAQIIRCKQICAISKADLVADKAVELYDGSEGGTHRKVIIFSQFQAVAFKIQQLLGHEAVGFISRGKSGFNLASPDERKRIVDNFQNNPEVKFIVCTTKAAQEGLDMTAAGFCIFTDLMWTPAAHEQAEGRSYGRMADSHPIDAYYMICEDTIETWIMELLDAKLQLINEVIEGVDQARDTSIAMAIIDKLKEAMWTKKKEGK